MGDEMKIKVPYRGGIVEAASAEIAAEAIARMERAHKREALMVERWSSETREQMARLCRSFPTLAGARGTDPWDVRAFLAWACGPEPSSGALHAARFVLSVWNVSVDWARVAAEEGIEGAACLTPFHLARAWSTWDEAHAAAALAWLELPFFP